MLTPVGEVGWLLLLRADAGCEPVPRRCLLPPPVAPPALPLLYKGWALRRGGAPSRGWLPWSRACTWLRKSS